MEQLGVGLSIVKVSDARAQSRQGAFQGRQDETLILELVPDRARDREGKVDKKSLEKN
jgi:hypothetical protein